MSELAEISAQVKQLHARYTDAVWRGDDYDPAMLITCSAFSFDRLSLLRHPAVRT